MSQTGGMGQPGAAGDEEQAVLLNALADDLLTPAQELRLVELLRTDSSFRRDYVRFCQLTTHLIWSAVETAKPATSAPGIERPPDERPLGEPPPGEPPPGEPPPGELAPCELAPGELLPVVSRGVDSHRRWLPSTPMSVVIIVMLVVAGVTWQITGTRSQADADLITKVTGAIVVSRPDQQSTWMRAEDIEDFPWKLQPGDRIQAGSAGSAVVTLSDGTRIRIGANTEAIYAATLQSRIQLLRGYLNASVAPQQMQHPLVFATPRASVQVLGTELELVAEGERTEVAVTEGKVRVTRNEDGIACDVAAGEALSVDVVGPLSVIRSPALPEEWQVDFEEGLPSGWIGKWVTTGLLAGSRGAAQGKPAGDRFVSRTLLASPLVDGGLFGWHPDSMLQFTFRVQPPAWFHICLETRSLQQTEPLILWCRVDPGLWQTRAGEWRTVRIPLTEFHQSGSVPPGTLLGRIPLRMSIVGPGDLPGVMVDSIRIDRSGLHNPGTQELITREGQR